jgi:hypothetical protein
MPRFRRPTLSESKTVTTCAGGCGKKTDDDIKDMSRSQGKFMWDMDANPPRLVCNTDATKRGFSG